MEEPAMSALAIARITPQDHSDWLRLFQEWHHHQSGTVTAEEKARAWQMLCDQNSGLFGLIGRIDDGTAVGLAHASLTPHAWAGGPILYLGDLFVTASMRSKGAGTEMLKAVYDLADEIGASQVFWVADERDVPLQRFYERHAVRTRYVRFMRRDWPWFAPGTH
jgi:GNAT superfamily N-acetyltransferase